MTGKHGLSLFTAQCNGNEPLLHGLPAASGEAVNNAATTSE